MTILLLACILLILGHGVSTSAGNPPSSRGDDDDGPVVLSKYFVAGPAHDIYWGLTDEGRTQTCILMSGFLALYIPYYTTDLLLHQAAMATIPVPRNASVSGTCGNATDDDDDVQTMTLTWTPHGSLLPHNLSLTFTQSSPFPTRLSFWQSDDDQEQVFYELTKVSADVQMNEGEFPNALNPGRILHRHSFPLEGVMRTRRKQSYFCSTGEALRFTEGGSLGVGLVHVEAFHSGLALGDGSDFGPESFCARDGLKVVLTGVGYVVVLAAVALAVFYVLDCNGKKTARFGYTYL